MTADYAKEELVRRYRYLYENAYFILSPFMVEMEPKNGRNGQDFEEPVIYLNINVLSELNVMFEEFLLTDKCFDDTALYKMVESKRDDKVYLGQVKHGLKLLDIMNKYRYSFPEELSIFKILNLTSDYIIEQSGDLENKDDKLKVIDEYYRLYRYKNNGMMYTSGRNLNLHDCSFVSVPIHKRLPFRNREDIGVMKNEFITTIVNIPPSKINLSIFTEKEKQEIYLDYHDEIPCDFEITCKLEDEYVFTMIDTRLSRPDNTSFCGEKFVVKEDEIFVDFGDKLYRYYQLCPHCGCIVNIRKELLSDGIKQRIEDRCSKDSKLFRKMYLYSELFSLDKESTKGQKKLLKKEK